MSLGPELSAEQLRILEARASSPHHCAFCGKGIKEVKAMVQAVKPEGTEAHATICDECVGVCVELMAEMTK